MLKSKCVVASTMFPPNLDYGERDRSQWTGPQVTTILIAEITTNPAKCSLIFYIALIQISNNKISDAITHQPVARGGCGRIRARGLTVRFRFQKKPSALQYQ